jgi:hypothetical protein
MEYNALTSASKEQSAHILLKLYVYEFLASLGVAWHWLQVLHLPKMVHQPIVMNRQT